MKKVIILILSLCFFSNLIIADMAEILEEHKDERNLKFTVRMEHRKKYNFKKAKILSIKDGIVKIDESGEHGNLRLTYYIKIEDIIAIKIHE